MHGRCLTFVHRDSLKSSKIVAQTACKEAAQRVECLAVTRLRTQKRDLKGIASMDTEPNCPNCGSPNIRKQEKPDKFKQKRATLWICRDCGYKYYRIRSFK